MLRSIAKVFLIIGVFLGFSGLSALSIGAVWFAIAKISGGLAPSDDLAMGLIALIASGVLFFLIGVGLFLIDDEFQRARRPQ